MSNETDYASGGSHSALRLFPHALRHTFATALLDPQAYGFERPAAPLTAVQDLLGHADPATTARDTHATHADLARIMGEPVDMWY